MPLSFEGRADDLMVLLAGQYYLEKAKWNTAHKPTHYSTNSCLYVVT